jgi:hypothetical protein
VLLRLAYLTASNTFAMLRLLPMGDRDKDVEVLAMRHQIAVLESTGQTEVRFTSDDRAFLAALLHRLPSQVLRRLRLLLRPDTVLRCSRLAAMTLIHLDVVDFSIERLDVMTDGPSAGRTLPTSRGAVTTVGTGGHTAVFEQRFIDTLNGRF